jgi:hypothetical protein
MAARSPPQEPFLDKLYGETAVRKLYANPHLFDGDFDNAEFAERSRWRAVSQARACPVKKPSAIWRF